MKKKHPALGSVIDFDRTRYPFDTLFLERVRATGGAAASVTALDHLHEHVASADIKGIYSALYALVREATFRDLYIDLVRRHIAPQFEDAGFRIQRVPGIRIHVPENRTVQYHSDYWYGHGPDVVNFWMPITRSFGTNALYVATLDDSLREIDTVVAERMRQPVIDERLQAICQPVELDLGGVKVFNAQTAHGSLPNGTGRTRISIDFRALPAGADPGSKDASEYYIDPSEAEPFATTAVSDQTLVVGSYIFPKHGFTRFVPATSQRAVVQAYAEQKQLRIVTEETEIFPMSHHPTLLNLAAGKGAESVQGVVLFSVLCLPQSSELRTEIYETAAASGTALFFANENLVYPHRATPADIEQALARVS